MRVSRKTRLQADLAFIESRITALRTAIISMDAGKISSFELNTGEADQKVVFKDTMKMQKAIDSLITQREHIYRTLQSQNFIRFTTNRRM